MLDAGSGHAQLADLIAIPLIALTEMFEAVCQGQQLRA
jgi:hypothetical protein